MSEPKYPLATIAAYGPNDRQATKLVVAVFHEKSDLIPGAFRKWSVASGEIREDPRTSDEIAAFMKEQNVVEATYADRILGCPHEAGIDYPSGEVCPRCPFWANYDPSIRQPIRNTSPKIGRNDPCPCGSGKKYKKCCGKP